MVCILGCGSGKIFVLDLIAIGSWSFLFIRYVIFCLFVSPAETKQSFKRKKAVQTICFFQSASTSNVFFCSFLLITFNNRMFKIHSLSYINLRKIHQSIQFIKVINSPNIFSACWQLW